jgi:hypothetical protein
MNAVEIEQAISELAEKPFDRESFPFEFLRAFGYKETPIRRLKAGETNKSDVAGVLHAKYIHIAIAPSNEVSTTLTRLRESPATAKHKARFILATDGVQFEAEDLTGGEPVVCEYEKFPDHFGFFLPLAGITTVKQIRENSFDIRATSRLNRLYVQLLKDNPDWGTAARRPDMNHFMARLIFCFFAEDTDIFPTESRFTSTVERMSARDSSNTHEVIQVLFLAMNLKSADRAAAGVPRWAMGFPYVNGGLFSGSLDVPRFNKIARSYLLHIGNLDWKQINPDIFGSMIQAVAEDEERGELGMHYTSVPNILKVLNPLFLDDLRARLEEAGDNKAKLLNLRKRMARIRVFDPACGSGNFLVIAYKEMRAIEAEINRRRDEVDRHSEIPLTNFRGIEIRDFAAEIARLALIIAEYQCDVLYRGPKLALAEFLPLEAQNWIVCGNALRIDWLGVCPPTGTTVRVLTDDLFTTPLAQSEIDFENEGGETYICGNPPYAGSKRQSAEQKKDLQELFSDRAVGWKILDYVSAWFLKAAEYGSHTLSTTAFVATNSICQGQQAPVLWPYIFSTGNRITFAYTSFKWSNLASHNAGVTVAVIGISTVAGRRRRLYSVSDDGCVSIREAESINAYLIPGPNVFVDPLSKVSDQRAEMQFGNHPYYGGMLMMRSWDARQMIHCDERVRRFIRPLYGSEEVINGLPRACLWISSADLGEAQTCPEIAARMNAVAAARRAAKGDKAAQKLAATPYRFRDQFTARSHVIVVPRHSSESREWLPVGLVGRLAIVHDAAFAMYDAPLWNFAFLVSKLHLAWVSAICGKLETRYRYSNTLGWNTFPVPPLTDKNKEDLTRCAVDILLAREAHFPATIADLYDPETMPADLRATHDRNDEVLERIYIGRRFRNDTERLEKLFELYTKMTAGKGPSPKKKTAGRAAS